MKGSLPGQLARFLVSGSCAFATDMGVYFLLLRVLPHSPSKAISCVVASLVAYLLNKYWTFDPERKTAVQLVKFYVLTVSAIGANVGVNKLFLILLPQGVLIAFLAASATSTAMNFAGQKWWVFR
jgi:putative flippase GtrA